MSVDEASDMNMGSISTFMPDLSPYEELRKIIHANPELSERESVTAGLVAKVLHSLDKYTVHEKIGSAGVAAVLKNGPGQTVMLRCELDALPLREQGSLAFASRVEQADRHGRMQPVAHVCGHDLHIVALLASAETLANMKTHWSGTLVLIFQPAEEVGTGAQAMLDDGLYDMVPTPDIVLNQHILNTKAGTVAIRRGRVLAAADFLKIVFHGKGGHGSRPEVTVDPVIMAAAAILRLQTIVSREIAPSAETAVVTIGSIHGGESANTIPDRVELAVSIRTIDEDTRAKVLAAVSRIIKAEAIAGGAARDPEIFQTARFPLTVNDASAVEDVIRAFRDEFGDQLDEDVAPIEGSDDFSLLARAVQRPYVCWFYGGTDPELYDKAQREGKISDLPYNHAPDFSPVTQPTLETGVRGYCAAALAIFRKE